MDTPIKIDTLEEALRVIFLESAKDTEAADIHMQSLLSSPIAITMNSEKQILLKEKLNSIIAPPSLGQLLQQAMKKVSVDEEAIAEKSNLPVSVVADLKSDAIYTNNIPIVLFKDLLSNLKLSFMQVEEAIRKTFEILQSQVTIRDYNHSGFTPAFRKGINMSKESISKNIPIMDGKELFENKEALDKYLARLKELMNN